MSSAPDTGQWQALVAAEQEVSKLRAVTMVHNRIANGPLLAIEEKIGKALDRALETEASVAPDASRRRSSFSEDWPQDLQPSCSVPRESRIRILQC